MRLIGVWQGNAPRSGRPQMNTGARLRTRFVAAGGTAGRGGTRAIGPRAAGDAKGVPPAAAGSPVGARWPNSGHALRRCF
ncbi:hypothetical protein NDU88_006291 [Pleurodeles waltl]|uniref:Uncharacterized protein n=1 Tax=Pleurodeles waltl TaxID=8319 RepID=A0AAV7NQB8_PLEWA|nr:hypothetical protein NDU88_006291 [Pleurodeles waltl]